MAKIEIRTMNGSETPCLNLNYPVGSSGKSFRVANVLDDVMLIQAMLRFVKTHDPSSNFSRAMKLGELPTVNGIFDKVTSKAIDIYQRMSANILLKVDGIIEPGSYQHRNIDTIHRRYRVMTITALDIDCSIAALVTPVKFGGSTTDNHIEGIIHEFPQLTLLRQP